jgi:hypothetical protein
MDDYQKWLEAAAGIEQDIEYLRFSLPESDIRSLHIALDIYRKNAASNVPWPNPDDLFCITSIPHGTHARIATDMRRDYKTAC